MNCLSIEVVDDLVFVLRIDHCVSVSQLLPDYRCRRLIIYQLEDFVWVVRDDDA